MSQIFCAVILRKKKERKKKKKKFKYNDIKDKELCGYFFFFKVIEKSNKISENFPLKFLG